jgi:hypothetical protein
LTLSRFCTHPRHFAREKLEITLWARTCGGENLLG